MGKSNIISFDVFNNILTVVKFIYFKREKIKLTNEIISRDLHISASSISEYRKNTRKVTDDFVDSLVSQYTHYNFDCTDDTTMILKKEYDRIFDLFFQAQITTAYELASNIIGNYCYLFSCGINYYLVLYAFVKFYDNDKRFIEISDDYYLNGLELTNEQKMLYQSLKAFYINMIHNGLASNRYVLTPTEEYSFTPTLENASIFAFYQLLEKQCLGMSRSYNSVVYPSKVFFRLGYINFCFMAKCNELYISIIEMNFLKIKHYLIELSRFKNQIKWDITKKFYFCLLSFFKLLYFKQFGFDISVSDIITRLFKDEDYRDFEENYVNDFNNLDITKQDSICLNYLLGVDSYQYFIDQLNTLSVNEILFDNRLKKGCKVLLLRIKYDNECNDKVKEDIIGSVERLLRLSMETNTMLF